MGIVGVKSTVGREVKFIDPSKTTKSESTWLGYTLCDWYDTIYANFLYTHAPKNILRVKYLSYMLYTLQ